MTVKQLFLPRNQKAELHGVVGKIAKMSNTFGEATKYSCYSKSYQRVFICIYKQAALINTLFQKSAGSIPSQAFLLVQEVYPKGPPLLAFLGHVQVVPDEHGCLLACPQPGFPGVFQEKSSYKKENTTGKREKPTGLL